MKEYRSSGCTHYGPSRLFKIGSAVLWAGNADELAERGGWAALISAVGSTKFTKNPLSGNDAAKALFPETLFEWTAPAVISIEWPDGGVPALSRDWWDRLHLALREIEGDVGLCCFGGHGRTGVMAAILAAKAGVVPKKACPVAWVRKKHCAHAVESTAQVDYVTRITGRKVAVGPSQKWSAGETLGAGMGGMGGTTKAANPTLPFPARPPKGTPTGTVTGAILDIDASDEALYEAWFDEPGMALTVRNESGGEVRIRPVWGDDGLAGWAPADG